MGSNARRPSGTTRADGARGHSDDTSRTPAVAVAWLRTATASLVLLAAVACSAQEPELLSVARRPSTVTAAGFGAFTYGGVWQGMEPVLRLEAELGRRLDVVHWFTSWDNDYYPEMVEAVTAGGRAPLISWQPHRQGVRDIAAGVYDEYVRAWARGVADAPGVVYLRPFPEMNGDWVPWNGDPDGLKAAWRHLAEIFAAEGADNVRWVFSPNVTDEPRVDDNRMELYYPGDDVVDVLALSGYNWGATRPYIGWRSFEEIFHTAYPRITALGPQPLWLAEIASSDEGGDKAVWVRDMFASTAFPRLEMVVWFDEDKEADWRVTSHPEVVQAFRDAFASNEVSASMR